MNVTLKWSRYLPFLLLAAPFTARGLDAQTRYVQANTDRVDAVVTDAANGVVYGLSLQGSNVLATSSWDGATWSLIDSNGPANRVFAGLAGAPGGGLVMIGGQAPGGGPMPANTTWVFNGSTWSALTVANSPSQRSGAASGQLGTGDAVIFGGVDPAGTTYLGDTWTFDGTNWTQVAGPGPSARYGATMCDDGTGNLLLFGGVDATTFYNDTWQFDGTAWTQLTPATTPPGRMHGAMAADPKPALPLTQSRDSVTLTGGLASGGAPLNDVWVYEYGDWNLQAFTAPTASGLLTGARDPQRREGVFTEPGQTSQFVVGEFGFTTYGFGCACTGGGPMIMQPGMTAPQIGATTSWDVANGVPNTFVLLAIDFAPAFVFITPACFRFVGLNGTNVGVVLSPTGTASVPLSIPNTVAMLGVTMFGQVFDSINACVSNAEEMRVGR